MIIFRSSYYLNDISFFDQIVKDLPVDIKYKL